MAAARRARAQIFRDEAYEAVTEPDRREVPPEVELSRLRDRLLVEVVRRDPDHSRGNGWATSRAESRRNRRARPSPEILEKGSNAETRRNGRT